MSLEQARIIMVLLVQRLQMLIPVVGCQRRPALGKKMETTRALGVIVVMQQVIETVMLLQGLDPYVVRHALEDTGVMVVPISRELSREFAPSNVASCGGTGGFNNRSSLWTGQAINNSPCTPLTFHLLPTWPRRFGQNRLMSIDW